MKEISLDSLSDSIINLEQIELMLELAIIYLCETVEPKNIASVLCVLQDKTTTVKEMLIEVDNK